MLLQNRKLSLTMDYVDSVTLFHTLIQAYDDKYEHTNKCSYLLEFTFLVINIITRERCLASRRQVKKDNHLAIFTIMMSCYYNRSGQH